MTEDEKIIWFDQIENLMNGFDFETIHNYMVHVNWKYYNDKIPSVEEIKEMARSLLINVINDQMRSCRSGGFLAIRSNRYLELHFTIESASIDRVIRSEAN